MNNKREIVYLDDNNNFVDKDKATKAIICEYDENGNLINERFMHIAYNNEKNTKINIDDLSEESKDLLAKFNFKTK